MKILKYIIFFFLGLFFTKIEAEITILESDGFTSFSEQVFQEETKEKEWLGLLYFREKSKSVFTFHRRSMSQDQLRKTIEFDLIDAWETIIGNPMIRKDVKALESVSKIIDNSNITNVITKTDLSNIVNKLAQKGVKCRTCTGGNSAYKYLDEILDDIEFGAVKYGNKYTSVLTGFKQGGNFAEGAMFVASSLKKYPNNFPIGTVFEFTEVTVGGVRRVDVRVTNTFFEFKSVALTNGMPPSGFANQFIKDLQLADVNDLSQIKWWFDASKTSNLSKAEFLIALENAQPSSVILDNLLLKFDPTGDWSSIVDLIDDNFDQIFKLK